MKQFTPVSKKLQKKFNFHPVIFRLIIIVIILFLVWNSLTSFFSDKFVKAFIEFPLSVLIFILFLVFEVRDNLKLSFKQYFKTVKSLKLSFIPILIFDALFFLTLLFTYLKLATILNSLVVELNSKVQELTPATLPFMKSFTIKSAALVIAFAMIAIFSFIIFKGTVWLLSLKLHEKLNTAKGFVKYYLKFGLLNLVWYSLFTLLSLIFAKLINPMLFPKLYIYIIVPLFFYLTAYLYVQYFTYSHSLWTALKTSLHKAVYNLPRFLLPLLIVVFFHLLLASLLFPLIFLSLDLNALSVVFMTFVYYNFVRFYLVRLILFYG